MARERQPERGLKRVHIRAWLLLRWPARGGGRPVKAKTNVALGVLAPALLAPSALTLSACGGGATTTYPARDYYRGGCDHYPSGHTTTQARPPPLKRRQRYPRPDDVRRRFTDSIAYARASAESPRGETRTSWSARPSIANSKRQGRLEKRHPAVRRYAVVTHSPEIRTTSKALEPGWWVVTRRPIGSEPSRIISTSAAVGFPLRTLQRVTSGLGPHTCIRDMIGG